MTTEQLKILEAHGWRPYYEKGNTPWIENPEFYSPAGKFCILEDADKFLRALDGARSTTVRTQEPPT